MTRIVQSLIFEFLYSSKVRCVVMNESRRQQNNKFIMLVPCSLSRRYDTTWMPVYIALEFSQLRTIRTFLVNSFRYSSETIFAAPDSTTSPPCWARVGGGLRRSAGSGSGSSASQDFHWRKEWDAKMRVELYSITNPTVFQLPV
ncbi:Hypothetical_protein [Hexamita inflata]|uniref:Hypothetical_protein n=1 Tax=Hexamita inflata TaxID=28002 RepID=A0AA86U299_9EUKA|nr:Hypothetical protein HINF_LOCUS23192 [Hexamita inflata]